MERTAFANALVILTGIIADDIRSVHFHAKFLLGEVDGRENGQIGVALAAARATYIAYLTNFVFCVVGAVTVLWLWKKLF